MTRLDVMTLVFVSVIVAIIGRIYERVLSGR